MNSNDWLVIFWTIPTLFELRKRHWISATWSACFAAFSAVGSLPPSAFTAPLRFGFLAAGALLVAYEVGKSYIRYKKNPASAR